MANEKPKRRRVRLKREPERLDRFFALRKTRNGALVVLGLAALALVVFNNPRAWADGTIATGIVVVAAIAGPICLLVIYWTDTRAASESGYCKGKFGKSPAELRAKWNSREG